MHYVKQFNINGVATKQVACIELQGKPNAATEGSLGVLGIDITSPSHDVYKCVAVNGATYTWELLSSGMSIISSTINSMGEATVQFSYDTLKTPNMYIVKSGDLILDKEGYLYQVASIYSTYCIATYCGTQIAKYGKSGVYLGDEEPTDPEIRVWVDPTDDDPPIMGDDGNISNALKGSKSGAAVGLHDVSPINHTIGVKVKGDNLSAVKVQKLGKNLIPFPYFDSSKTIRGITFTVNEDGSVTLNGTWNGGNSSASSDFHLLRFAYLRPGKYCLSNGVNSGSTYTYRLFGHIIRTDGTQSYVSVTTAPKEFELYEGDTLHISIRIDYQIGTVSNLKFYPQLELGTTATEYERYIKPTEYSVNADGSVDGVTSIYPSTTLTTDTAGVVMNVEYNRDINKAFAELYNALISMGGNI